MNERQQAHIDYFLERVEYWKGQKRDYWVARMLAARDADHAHPLRSEEEGSEVVLLRSCGSPATWLRFLRQSRASWRVRREGNRETLTRRREFIT